MYLKILKGSENYTCQVIKLPTKQPVKGLDNLVSVAFQGNSCLVSKESDENSLYLFFPAGCKLSSEYLSANNLYRHKELNKDKEQSGFFEDNGRVKTIKFKGVISSGFIIPLHSLQPLLDIRELKLGNEFNEINGNLLCWKFITQNQEKRAQNKVSKVIDNVVESKFVPEHIDTAQLLKNVSRLSINDWLSITYKLHGTSSRIFNTLVKRKLSLLEKVAKYFGAKIQEEQYEYVCGSRRVIKSCGFEELPNKNHFFSEHDLWSMVGKKFFEGKLNQGEAVYYEIIGKTFAGEEIQKGYTYGYEHPTPVIYRISNINPQGIEVDLSWNQVKERAAQLGVDYCPELFQGTLGNFLELHDKQVKDDRDIEPALSDIFYSELLEQPSILDKSVVEEGFCIRIETCNKPIIYKIKSKQFLLHESGNLDKEVVDIEEEQNI